MPRYRQDTSHMFLSAKYWENTTDLRKLQRDIEAANSVNHTTKTGVSPLMYACRWTWGIERVELLLENGADVNHADRSGDTPLIWACLFAQDAKLVELLIDYGADVDQTTKQGQTALTMSAANVWRPEVIEALVDAGADVNFTIRNTGMTPFLYAVAHNENEEVPLTLLDLGADPNARSKKGQTALDFIGRNRELLNSGVYQFLKESYTRSRKDGWNPPAASWVDVNAPPKISWSDLFKMFKKPRQSDLEIEAKSVRQVRQALRDYREIVYTFAEDSNQVYHYIGANKKDRSKASMVFNTVIHNRDRRYKPKEKKLVIRFRDMTENAAQWFLQAKEDSNPGHGHSEWVQDLRRTNNEVAIKIIDAYIDNVDMLEF